MLGISIKVQVQSWGKRLSLLDGATLADIGTYLFDRLERRIKEQGVDGEGRRLEGYSSFWPTRTRRLKAGMAEHGGWVLSMTARSRWGGVRGGAKAGTRKRWFKSMSAFRQAQGLPTGHKTFSLTGEMWRSKVVKVKLVWGKPEVQLTWAGTYVDWHTQDYWLQLRKAARQRRAGGSGHTRWTKAKSRRRREAQGGQQHTYKTDLARMTIRKASPQMKASMCANMRPRQNRGPWWLLSSQELADAQAKFWPRLSQRIQEQIKTEQYIK